MKKMVAISGGETSAYMAMLVKSEHPESIFVFANTGQENEETLEFLNWVDNEFKLNIVWLEAVTHEGRIGCTHKVVNFETACRNGDVFMDMCKKYGLPNKYFLHCTRELKENPIKSYLRSINNGNWQEYQRNIGIRIDEIDRVSPTYKEQNLWYPLAFDTPTTKIEINEFWVKQERRLELKQYQGNCKWCYKKTLRKHLTMISETPEYYDFARKLEIECSHIKPKEGEEVRNMFRGERTVDDLFKLALEPFDKFHDEARVYNDTLLDSQDGCSESCEPFQQRLF